MNASHTPGPWMVGSSDSPDYMGDLPEGSLYVEASGNDLICEIDSCGVPLPSHAANARLIAAAPDLLESLTRLLDDFCPLTNNPSHAELVRHWEYARSEGDGLAEGMLQALAAIAKARGDQTTTKESP